MVTICPLSVRSALIPAGGIPAYVPAITSGCLQKLNCVEEKQQNTSQELAEMRKTATYTSFYQIILFINYLFPEKKKKWPSLKIMINVFFTCLLIFSLYLTDILNPLPEKGVDVERSAIQHFN